MTGFARLLSGGFTVADRLLPDGFQQPGDAASLLRAARANPAPGTVEALERLLQSIRAESSLSLFGRLSLRWDFLRLLRNAELVERAHRDNPAIAAAPVAAPVFILGLPRSGTSFLHDLLAQDPDNQVPRNWQTIYPAPRPAGFDPTRDKRVRTVDAQLNLFEGLAPGFRDMHPITADSPQECSEITAHVFQSLRFDTTHRVPGYFAWLEAHGHQAAFEFHKKFLQYLQNGKASRWVLKCPDHTFTLDAILQVYPDARFVIVHRDPIAVLASVAHLTQILRKPFLREIDAAEIGAQVAARWTQGANLLLDFDQRADVPAAHKIHLHYQELTADPLGTVARIYAQFGQVLTNEARVAMTAQLQAKPNGGYRRHAPYGLETFKLSVPALQQGFAPYVQKYCAPPQSV